MGPTEGRRMTPLGALALGIGVFLWAVFIYFVLAPLLAEALAYFGAVVGAVAYGETRRAKRHRQPAKVVPIFRSDIRRDLPRDVDKRAA